MSTTILTSPKMKRRTSSSASWSSGHQPSLTRTQRPLPPNGPHTKRLSFGKAARQVSLIIKVSQAMGAVFDADQHTRSRSPSQPKRKQRNDSLGQNRAHNNGKIFTAPEGYFKPSNTHSSTQSSRMVTRHNSEPQRNRRASTIKNVRTLASDGALLVTTKNPEVIDAAQKRDSTKKWTRLTRHPFRKSPARKSQGGKGEHESKSSTPKVNNTGTLSSKIPLYKCRSEQATRCVLNQTSCRAFLDAKACSPDSRESNSVSKRSARSSVLMNPDAPYSGT